MCQWPWRLKSCFFIPFDLHSPKLSNHPTKLEGVCALRAHPKSVGSCEILHRPRKVHLCWVSLAYSFDGGIPVLYCGTLAGYILTVSRTCTKLFHFSSNVFSFTAEPAFPSIRTYKAIKWPEVYGKIWKILNNKNNGQKWCAPQIPSCNMPSDQQWKTVDMYFPWKRRELSKRPCGQTSLKFHGRNFSERVLTWFGHKKNRFSCVQTRSAVAVFCHSGQELGAN